VGAAPGEPARLAKGTRFVAFLDAGGALAFAAAPRVGPSLEQGVLLIWRFAYTNGSLVTPGMITFAQLERYLRTGALAYSIRGTLHVPAAGTLTRSQPRDCEGPLA
jgi:hypothetical protein